MVPHFRKGDYAGGVSAGVVAILQTIEGTYQGESSNHQSKSPELFSGLEQFFIAIAVGTFVGLMFSCRKALGWCGSRKHSGPPDSHAPGTHNCVFYCSSHWHFNSSNSLELELVVHLVMACWIMALVGVIVPRLVLDHSVG